MSDSPDLNSKPSEKLLNVREQIENSQLATMAMKMYLLLTVAAMCLAGASMADPVPAEGQNEASHVTTIQSEAVHLLKEMAIFLRKVAAQDLDLPTNVKRDDDPFRTQGW
ncbi:uncharacterized protein LOC144863414 [Branchiostoma floridae x Branchiostoma japonicum]